MGNRGIRTSPFLRRFFAENPDGNGVWNGEIRMGTASGTVKSGWVKTDGLRPSVF